MIHLLVTKELLIFLRFLEELELLLNLSSFQLINLKLLLMVLLVKLLDLKKKLQDLKVKSRTSGLMKSEMSSPELLPNLKLSIKDLMLLRDKLPLNKLKLLA